MYVLDYVVQPADIGAEKCLDKDPWTLVEVPHNYANCNVMVRDYASSYSPAKPYPR